MGYNSEIPKNKRKGKIKFDKDYLYTEHITKHKTVFRIAKENDTTANTIERQLKNNNIPIWKRHDNTNEYIDNQDGTTSVKVYNQFGDYLDSFLIDTNKVDYVKKYKWILTKDNIVKDRPRYRVMTAIHPSIILGRYLLNIDDENLYVDHIDNNPLNNIITNLRITTRTQNQINHDIQSNNTSGFTGVTWDNERNKWQARIKYKDKNISAGRYTDKCDAIYARYIAENLIFGEYRSNRNDEKIFEAIKHCNNKEKIQNYIINKIQNYVNLASDNQYAERIS